MLYAYFLDIQPGETDRNNSKIFQLIQELDIADAQIFADDNPADRAELYTMLDLLTAGDMLIIRSVTDLTDDINVLLTDLFPQLSDKKVELFSCEEPYLCGMEYEEALNGFIELLRYFRAVKKMDSYQRALEDGRVGRPAKTEAVEKAVKLYQSGIYTISQIETLTGVSKSTLYRYLKEEQE